GRCSECLVEPDMNCAAKCVLAFALTYILSGQLLAQQVNPLFLKIENAIRQMEPEWTLMNRWPAPTGQAIGFRWKSDHQEIGALIIFQRTTADATLLFQDDGLGQIPGKGPRLNLNLGDECYLRQSGRNTAVILRKNNLLVRLGSNSSEPEALIRFARHVAAALDETETLIDPNELKRQEARKRLSQRESALTHGNYHAAIEEFRNAIGLDAESADAYQALGTAYSKIGDRARAIEAFKEAVRLRPEWPEAHYQLGTSYYEAGEYSAAASAFEEAVRLKPDYFDALVGLGRTYQHAGLHARSVEALQKAVALRSDNIDAKTALGTAFLMAGRPDKAVTTLNEVVRLSPDSAVVYAALGQAYRLTGKFAKALDAIEQALRISPEDPVAHNYLGQTYASLDRHSEAMDAYQRSVTLKPDYAEAHYNLGLVYLSIGEPGQAQAEYIVLRNLNSKLADILLLKITAPNP